MMVGGMGGGGGRWLGGLRATWSPWRWVWPPVRGWGMPWMISWHSSSGASSCRLSDCDCSGSSSPPHSPAQGRDQPRQQSGACSQEWLNSGKYYLAQGRGTVGLWGHNIITGRNWPKFAENHQKKCLPSLHVQHWQITIPDIKSLLESSCFYAQLRLKILTVKREEKWLAICFWGLLCTMFSSLLNFTHYQVY